MKQKTAIQLAIEALEQKKKSLREMDLLGILMPGEYTHKQNEINSIQIMLAEYLFTERERIEEAYSEGVGNMREEAYGIKNTIQASDYYQQKYGDEKHKSVSKL